MEPALLFRAFRDSRATVCVSDIEFAATLQNQENGK
jgi:hypothetical protein